MQKITAITGTEVKDSRGRTTIAVTVKIDAGEGTFSVPSGASTGAREVVALPSTQALRQLHEVVAPALIGADVMDQSRIDATLHELDGTENFSAIGGNTALGVSLATARVGAQAAQLPLWQYIATLFNESPQAVAPRLFVNLINGGKHASVGSDIQEHQVVVDIDDPRAALTTIADISTALERLLIETYGRELVTVGDEGGFVIPSQSIDEPFDFLRRAASVSTQPWFLSADAAASSFAVGDQYHLDGQVLNAVELQARYQALHTAFPELQAVEDPFAEDDLEAFTRYRQQFPQVLVVGDDVTTTNEKMLQTAISASAINGIIIKPNQIGTLTDTLHTMRTAYRAGVRCIVSHRSGETMDDFIADLAFGTKAYGLKAGAPTMPVRKVKYERLLTILDM